MLRLCFRLFQHVRVSPVHEAIAPKRPAENAKRHLVCVKHFMNTPVNRGTILQCGDFECNEATPCRPCNPLLYKTLLCERYDQGVCRNGPLCFRAHGREDLREGKVHRCQEHGEWRAVEDLTVETLKCSAEKPCQKPHPQWRMKPCLLLEKCPNGLNCLFAHSKEALRDTRQGQHSEMQLKNDDIVVLPSLGDQLLQCMRHFQLNKRRNGSIGVDGDFVCNEETPCSGWDPALAKTELCRRYRRGICKNGAACYRAHGLEELRIGVASRCRKHGELRLVSDLTSDGKICIEGRTDCRNGNRASLSATMQMYKTKMCRQWEAKGSCSNGDDCFFAHSYAELRKDPTKTMVFVPCSIHGVLRQPKDLRRIGMGWEARCTAAAPCKKPKAMKGVMRGNVVSKEKLLLGL